MAGLPARRRGRGTLAGGALLLLITLAIPAGLSPAWAQPAQRAAAPARTRAASGCAVPIVIDFGTSPKAPRTQSGCSGVRPGATGLAALSAFTGGRYDAPGGFVCTIEGWPRGDDTSGGSSTCSTPSDYWAYWHRCPTTGDWVYSDTGAGDTHTRRGWAEGWAYETGSTRAPDGGRAAATCPARPARPRPSPSRSPTAPASTGSGHRGSRPAPTATPSSATRRRASGRPTTGGPPHRRAGARQHGTRHHRRPATTRSATPSGTLAASRRRANGGGPAGGGDGPLVGLIAGLVVAAGLAGAAVLRYRRG
jgi:hypothetical protein